ncbi:MAG: hypothetical protein UU51_C0006G0039 [Microgenomates group bacterium GW2011_GWC1_41_20]|uniref:Uncharacterized protein n=7 Tax=Candidatus Woeseibacteriota TaxID=1752722 RepID=A0A0G0S100_9BACT|nr:MAG: hypothetical protein UT76_C0015G0008 [Candidatus Woesebacteria bacterium GW2011_GWB1_40_12]KKR55911.1 MAG: hypothetical protein UT93_C0011G0025 [Candidatus Woesebacteria bacterium GW2011_GWF1_40_24]KKR90892.1 MAG: hypothetical protein UU39_C0005G0018 [Candidatus Woesebacteria bacterium GW2011_GWD1_41_12]KKS00516.1 MAG: hypothetical protein UU51_C0006G0039 [Microgenomates group bacterium GW2011_GWC1_41_20]KKS05617.1 MAG: hypothetical protein UU57_C0003G0008 [Candidatus Woesebacteria bact
MSTNKIDIEKEVMSRVTSGEIAMKPRWYFVAGSVFMLLGTIAAAVAVAFLINLTIFLIKKQGPGYGRLAIMFESFPFWIPILAILGIGIGILLLRKYDFSYKKNFLLMIIGFIATVAIAGFVIDGLGLNDIWSRGGLMKGFYQRIENQGKGGLQNGKGNGYNRR